MILSMRVFTCENDHETFSSTRLEYTKCNWIGCGKIATIELTRRIAKEKKNNPTIVSDKPLTKKVIKKIVKDNGLSIEEKIFEKIKQTNSEINYHKKNLKYHRESIDRLTRKKLEYYSLVKRSNKLESKEDREVKVRNRKGGARSNR